LFIEREWRCIRRGLATSRTIELVRKIDARAAASNLGRLITDPQSSGEAVKITKDVVPAAVLLSVGD
jgi:hypothetical protein